MIWPLVATTTLVGFAALWFPPRAPGWAVGKADGWVAWLGRDTRRLFRLGFLMHLAGALSALAWVYVGQQRSVQVDQALKFQIWSDGFAYLTSGVGYFGRYLMLLALARWAWLPEGVGTAAVTLWRRRPCSRARFLAGRGALFLMLFTALFLATLLWRAESPAPAIFYQQAWNANFMGVLVSGFSILLLVLAGARLLWPPAEPKDHVVA